MDRETGNLSERLVYRVYRGQTTIIALGLIFLGTVSLVFVNSTLPEDTLWYHLIRDISIVALISGFITTLYEYLIRDQFFYQLRTTQIDQVERLQSLLQQEFDRQRKYFPRIIDEVPYEVQKAVRTAVNEDLKNELSTLLANLESTATQSLDQNLQWFPIRELSHALNTPLSQIEASTLTLLHEQAFKSDSDLEATLRSIRASVDICKSVLAAFRELARVSRSSNLWSPSSLRQALETSAEVYMRSHNRNVNIYVRIPDTIEGYSNNYMMALLLPLLENAIEASPDEGQVEIRDQDLGQEYLVRVTNQTENSPRRSNEIYKSGFTTKEGHEGMGLSIVQHLLSSHRGAELEHKVIDDTVIFTVKLPGEVGNGF